MTEQQHPAEPRRIGVYVCHCGGNISDYVDVEGVIANIRDAGDVVVSKTAMFACSDATQQDMVHDIEEQGLDGLVVASCSPKLHTYTFRGVASRAGLNPFEYTQVNIREQCSWVHTDDEAAATDKATALVRAGIDRTRLTTPLVPLVVETLPHTLVIGGGIAGLRAAIGLADIGLRVTIVERELQLGGWVRRFGPMFPHQKNGHELIATLVAEVKRRPAITVLTGAEVVAKSGSFGNYRVSVRIGDEGSGAIEVAVGSIVVATGFDAYEPAAGEFGYGIDGVVTLPEFKELVDASKGSLAYHGRPVRSLAYVYCVGSRQPADAPDANQYCSRYCCTATVHTSIQVAGLDPTIRQFHLYRDMRTYGKFEPLYTESREAGSVFLKYAQEAPPAVARDGRWPVDGHGARPAHRERRARDPGRPRGPGDRHGPAQERGAGRRPQAPGRVGRVLQRDPPEAAAGRDRRRRGAHRRRLPGSEDLVGERRVGPRRGHPERGGPQEGLHRARPARRDRPSRRLQRAAVPA